MSAAVELPAAIAGKVYVLTFKFGSMRLAERELGRKITAVFSGLEDLGLDEVSALFWAVLQTRHAMDRDASDALIDEAGIVAVVGWIARGLADYFEPGDAEPGAAEGNAPPAATPATPAKPRSRRS
jgi:hypothetical protein